MNKLSLPFIFYMLITGALVFLIFITPYLAFLKKQFANFLYDDVFSYICHQKISRSLCLFKDDAGYHVEDCLPQTGAYRNDLRSEKSALHDGLLGYKFPVSARDMLIYVGMFTGGIALFITNRANSRTVPHAIFFILALVPIGIDGITQSVLEWRESTNLIRAATGFIAGFATGIYAPLILNHKFLKCQEAPPPSATPRNAEARKK